MESITNPQSPASEHKRPYYMGFLFFTGFLLPAISLSVELATRICADTFFDPMPTWWHSLFVFFVGTTNLQTWWAIRQNRRDALGWLGFANAVTIFIALFYTVLFAPILPIAVFGLLMVLLGLLPMTPILSLIAALLMRRDLRRMSPGAKPFFLRWQGLASGFLLVFLAMGAAEATFVLTKIGVNLAGSDSPEKQVRGLNFIRRYGDENYLLRLCYGRSGVVTTEYLVRALHQGGFIEKDDSQSSPRGEKARKVFYRLKGTDYRSVKAPYGVRGGSLSFNDEETEETEARGVNQGLSLAGSQIDGSIDGDAALSYLEWTLLFKNEKSWQQEAVAQIQLPPGAVVSRLTLWINGEEREAAFARRGQVTDAYNSVVSVRKDPVLVTTSGKDRISMRAFPVPAGGEMKVRVGITAPLETDAETFGHLPLPHFEERNFAVTAEHSVWFESKKPLEISNPNFIQEQISNSFAVRGKVKTEELAAIGLPVRAIKSGEVKTAWTRDKNDPQKIIRQEIKESSAPQPERIVFVVDASRKMKDFQKEIAGVLANFSFAGETALVLTGGGFDAETAAPNYFVGSLKDIAGQIANATFEGGTDNAPAIETAWNLAQESNQAAIVWIHAPQLVELSSPQNLKQFWARRPDSPILYSLKTRLGADTTERVLNESSIVESVPRFGRLSDDLTRLLSDIGRQKQKFEFVRTQVNLKDFKP
ncbi:MAG TPA: VIT domain-containing protein, partial [Pyrinomonadaceae bacterium]|nr:VIT domain-containing protein [Pyrinomonadaceae bacterium]